jgi:nitrate/nitrite-specific signal transduction histidine kinase
MNQEFVEELVTTQEEIPQIRSFSFVGFLQPVKQKVRALLGIGSSSGFLSTTIEQDLFTFLRSLSTRGVRCEINITGRSREYGPEVRQQIGEIAREALVNALLHSRASCIEAEIEYSTRRLRVIVRDDGRGMAPNQMQSQQNAAWDLARMRKQAEQIGAQLTVWSKPGAGTEVEISVPCRVLMDACA